MTRAVGCDISKYQQSFEPQGNIDFVIQRVSYGLKADEKFKELLPGVKTIERRGAYHYFYTGIDPIAQAEFFYIQQGNQGFKFLAVDYEGTGNTLDKQGEYNLAKFHEHLYFLTDKPILLYTSPYIYRDNVIAYNKDWELVPLWMANYNSQDPQTGAPETWGSDWLFWQHTSKGNGAEYGVGSEFVDLNVFNGTVEELDTWLGSTEPSPINCDEQVAEAVKQAQDECREQIAVLNKAHEEKMLELVYAHKLVLEETEVKANNTALENLIKPYLK